MDYRENETYKALEKILQNAGVKIDYLDIPEDIHGRTHAEDLYIQMPEDPEAYKEHSDDYAALILGHEAGHILSNPYVCDPVKRTVWNNEKYITEDETTLVNNEALADLIGVYLYRLADLTATKEAEQQLIGGGKSTIANRE